MKKEGYAMKKKLFAVVLAAAIAMTAASLCGCGEEKTEIDNTAVSATTPSKATKDSVGTTAAESSAAQETTAATVSTSSTEATTKASEKSSATSENKSSNFSNTGGSSAENRNTNVAVTSVSLSKSSISMFEGDSASFEVYINPDNATDRQYNVVTNNGNASIDCNGSTVTVYGENRGNCEITVSSTNGKSAACSVIVNSRTSYSNSGSGNSGGSGNNTGGNSGNSGGNLRGGSGNSEEINDDTLLTHAQICSDYVMGRVCDAINEYFVSNLNMTYNGSLTKNDCGWFLSGSNYYLSDNRHSINSIIGEETYGFELELYALVDTNNGSRADIHGWQFRCYYERQSNGEYRIYFCHY